MRPSAASAAGAGGAPFLPVLPGAACPGSSRRRTPKPWTEAEEGADLDETPLVKSLQLKNDARYVRMNHYDQGRAERYACGHVAHLKKANRCMAALPPEAVVVTQTSTYQDISSWDIEAGEASGERAPRCPVATIDERLEWQDAFDHKVRRLLVDFQLSDVPACRLNHLERMHTWFEEHGGKQTRKAREGPSYLTADRSERMWEGSTKDLPRAGNSSTQFLSQVFRKLRT